MTFESLKNWSKEHWYVLGTVLSGVFFIFIYNFCESKIFSVILFFIFVVFIWISLYLSDDWREIGSWIVPSMNTLFFIVYLVSIFFTPTILLGTILIGFFLIVILEFAAQLLNLIKSKGIFGILVNYVLFIIIISALLGYSYGLCDGFNGCNLGFAGSKITGTDLIHLGFSNFYFSTPSDFTLSGYAKIIFMVGGLLGALINLIAINWLISKPKKERRSKQKS